MATKKNSNVNVNTNTVAASDNQTADNGNVVAIIDTSTHRSAHKAVRGMFDTVEIEMSDVVKGKMEILGTVRQQLAEASDLLNEGSDKANEAKSLNAKAGLALYQAQSRGVITKDEVTAALGDAFGYRKKGDAKAKAQNSAEASKTPFGEGDSIRKRVIRLAAASSALTDNTKDGELPEVLESNDRFFDGLSTVDLTIGEGEDAKDFPGVRSIVEQVEDGTLSIYSGYDYLTKLKSAMRERSNPVFDPAKVQAMVETLAEEGAIDTIRGNVALRAAYTGLWKMLNEMNAATATAEAA